jgi:hypothetical protein
VADRAGYFGGSLWVACLRGRRLYRIPVTADGSFADLVALLSDSTGRLRTVAAASDGSLWFTPATATVGEAPRDGDEQILKFRF